MNGAQKRGRDEPEPRSGRKQLKAEPAPWYSKFWHVDALPKVAMAQSDIAGFCVRQMTRLATFMDQNGDEQYDWYAVLGRYAPGGKTSDSPDYERILWEFEGVAGYLTQVQELQGIFEAKDYSKISVHLDHLKDAIDRYMRGNADVEPAAVRVGASLEEACTAFVHGFRHLCVKMSSMHDKGAPWDQYLEKLSSPGTQASASMTLDAVGVEFAEQALRDIMATTRYNHVKSIASKLSSILAQVEERRLSVKAHTHDDAARAKARTFREKISMEIDFKIRRDFSTVRKAAQVLPVPIATKTKEMCRDDLVRYFCQTFQELSLARAFWNSMIAEASQSAESGDRLLQSLQELVAERDAEVWHTLLREKAGPTEFQARYDSIKEKYGDAVAYDRHLCKKTDELYREIRHELFIFLHKARALEM